jgi:hypothetical protein
MSTDLDLVNSGLALVGQDRVVSLDNTVNSKVIQTANFFLPRVKQAVLRAHDWNCARRRAALVAVTNESLGEWGSAYRLPADCLAVRKFVSDYDEVAYAPYSVEIDSGDLPVLYTNEATAKLVYTGYILDVNRWDVLLFDAAATRLAVEFAAVFPRDMKFVEMMWRSYQLKIDEAQGVNETEGGIARNYSNSIAGVR